MGAKYIRITIIRQIGHYKKNINTKNDKMDYLNDFVPGLISTLNISSFKEFKDKVSTSNFIQPRGTIQFDPAKTVFNGEEVILKFKAANGYDEFEKLTGKDDLSAVYIFYTILKKQLEVNPRACFFESIERLKGPVIDEGEVKYLPLFMVNFRR